MEEEKYSKDLDSADPARALGLGHRPPFLPHRGISAFCESKFGGEAKVKGKGNSDKRRGKVHRANAKRQADSVLATKRNITRFMFYTPLGWK